MKILLFILAAVIVVLYVCKTRMDYYHRIIVKALMTYAAIGVYGIAILMLLGTGITFFENAKSDTMERRMLDTAWYCSNGDFDGLAFHMRYNRCYEEEFEYLWEQIDMYDTYSEYQIYSRAAKVRAGTPEGEDYEKRAAGARERLQEICENSVFQQNQVYVEYYKDLIGE